VDKCVVVTGAGTGIGQAVAGRLRADGYRVTGMGRDRSRVDVSVDIRDAAAVDAAFAGLGPLYGLVANAGIGGPNEPGPGDRFEDLVRTNLLGTYSCCRAAQRLGVRRIVVTSSILARIAVPGYTGYSASKAGLLGLVRSLAAELAPATTVNAVVPGWVDTDMAWEGLDALPGTRDEAFAEAMKAVPLGRMTRPDEIAATVAWLLSDDAAAVTGQGIDHNAGAWMG
jgi:NAD(P)-dependent dehydrogenase (short-subunit alcohol dehydrogenase family)